MRVFFKVTPSSRKFPYIYSLRNVLILPNLEFTLLERIPESLSSKFHASMFCSFVLFE
jgi:hypothetical protein